MSANSTFKLTGNHIKLVRKMFVQWNDAEFGAPEIDPKRPYGNSDVLADVAEILGIELGPDNDELTDPRDKKTLKKLEQLHKETLQALQIILATGKFVTGTYEKTDEYDDTSWRRV